MGRKSILAVACVLAISISVPATAEKYDPEHPVVVEMIKRGVAYLSKAGGGNGSGPGRDVLIGYAIYKADTENNADHPLVKRALDQALRLAQHMASTTIQWDHEDMYAVPVAAMFLSTYGPDKYGDALRAIRNGLLAAQRPSGGFGYMNEGPHKAIGAVDISQSQYVMLAFWSMQQVNIEVPPEAILNCLNCLARAQHQNGGWPYQWAPTPLPSNVDARLPTNSLSAAGLSAYLIAGDTLGAFRGKYSGTDDEDIIPKAFKRVDPDESKKKKISLDKDGINNVLKKAEGWFNANPYTRNQQFHYYYVYSKERFEAFLEVAKGKKEKSPSWYNEMVEQLAREQGPDGSWNMSGDILSSDVSTCFAILFLIRSTQKAIGELHDDNLLGGQGLDPSGDVVFKDGKMLKKSEATSLDDALKILDAENKTDTPESLVPDKLVLPKDANVRKEYLRRFARLMRSKDYKVRRFAAKLLGRGDDLDFVPDLVFGLSDSDTIVQRSSEASLRLISRQLDTYYLPREGKISEPEKINAVIRWQKWYLSVRPDYVFLD
jgi:hypothetical protein